jgi:hypothetical protein
MTIITTYTLKADTDYDAFKRWSEEVDQPACRVKDICQRFDVYRAASKDVPEGRVDIIEVIETTSAAEWDAAMNAPDHAYVFDGWKQFCELDSLRITYCEPL